MAKQKTKSKQPSNQFCMLSNSCKKTICCSFCKVSRCNDRCYDNNAKCKWATDQEKTICTVKKDECIPIKIKPWNKDEG